MLKSLLRIVAVLLAILLGAGLCVFLCLAVLSPGKTLPFTDPEGKVIENSVAEIRYVDINGFEQYMLIRGKNTDNPVLLVLHGGPGSPEAPLLHAYNSILEDHFIVVNWDQRGSGGSYDSGITPEDISIEKMLDDTKDVVDFLKKEFKKEKVFILGHSWGSFLGTCFIYRHPEDVIAYAGVGQIGNIWKSERESYDFVLNTARETGNRKAVEELESIGFPVKGLYASGNSATVTERSWVNEFGGAAYKTDAKGLMKYFKSVLTWREYTLKNKLCYMKGANLSFEALWEAIMDYALHEKVTRVEVPFFVIQGKHDYQTTYAEAKAYFDAMEAPYKEFFTFDSSSHYLLFNREAEKFNTIMLETIRPLADE